MSDSAGTEGSVWAAELAGRWLYVAPPTQAVVMPYEAEPSFSIVIAAYQAAAFIADAIESGLAQTHPASEIIVCDDGSTDATAEVAASYGDRVVVVRQTHRGVGAAKNACVGAASGDFVVILDADNYLLPGCLEAFAAVAFARPDLEIITSDGYLELDGRIFDRYYRKKARFVVDDQRLGALHQHFVYGQAALRRQSVDAVGGFDESLPCGVDTDLFLRMILSGSQVGLVLEPLSTYRLRPGSLSSDRARSMEAMVTILERARLHPSLSSHERSFLERDLAEKQRLTLLALAERDLRGASPDARARVWQIARNVPPVFDPATRVKAALTAAAPPLARLILKHRERDNASRLRALTHGR